MKSKATIKIVKDAKDGKEIWIGYIFSDNFNNHECIAKSEEKLIEGLEEYVTELSHEIHMADLELNALWLACPEDKEEKAIIGGDDK